MHSPWLLWYVALSFSLLFVNTSAAVAAEITKLSIHGYSANSVILQAEGSATNLVHQLEGTKRVFNPAGWQSISLPTTGRKVEWQLSNPRLDPLFLRLRSESADAFAQPLLPPFDLRVPVKLTLIDSNAIGYATFQSHNQKVVSSSQGVFLAYNYAASENYRSNSWRLVFCTNSASSFGTVLDVPGTIHPPVLETDSEMRVFLAHAAYDGNAYLYQVAPLAIGGIRGPFTITNGYSGKICMSFDSSSRELAYMVGTWATGPFRILSPAGDLLWYRELFSAPATRLAQCEYPHISRDPASRQIFVAWTTQRIPLSEYPYLYWDIHCMKSGNGGRDWFALSGREILPPVPPDNTGPADQISLDSEFSVHTWLSSFMFKEGKLHFVYWVDSVPQQQKYVRLDANSGVREKSISRIFGGSSDQVAGLDGFFAGRSTVSNSTMYFVSSIESETRLACMASDDNGSSWYRYAESDVTFPRGRYHGIYSITGARELTASGAIIGAFTQLKENSETFYEAGSGKVFFFTFQGGLCSARVVRHGLEGGKLKVEFGLWRGNPRRVRFQHGGGEWSNFVEFSQNVEIPADTWPRQFQLESSLGVISPPHDFGPVVESVRTLAE